MIIFTLNGIAKDVELIHRRVRSLNSFRQHHSVSDTNQEAEQID